MNERKRSIYQGLAEVVASFAAPVRLQILQILAQAPRPVEDISMMVGESAANVSQHLQRMHRAGIVARERHGLQKVYSIRSRSLAELWESLQDVAQELRPELTAARKGLIDPALFSAESAAAIVRKVRAGKALLLDARPEIEVENTPVRVAKPLPKKLDEIPRNLPLYVFCRGRYCEMAAQAVKRLRRRGYAAYCLGESTTKLNRLCGKTDTVKG